MSTNKIQTNIYKCQSKLYNYLNKIYIIPNNNNNNNIMSVKTYIQQPIFKKTKKQKTSKHSNKLNLLIEAVEYIEKQPLQNII
jgi:hypothetical protein